MRYYTIGPLAHNGREWAPCDRENPKAVFLVKDQNDKIVLIFPTLQAAEDYIDELLSHAA